MFLFNTFKLVRHIFQARQNLRCFVKSNLNQLISLTSSFSYFVQATCLCCRDEERDSQLYVWQGYTGKVELISFRTFLTRPVRRVSLGGDHSLILTYDDCLYSCGSNEHGQLGVSGLAREYSFDPCVVDNMSGEGCSLLG